MRPTGWSSATNQARLPASLADGTSNTVLFGERYQVCGVTPMLWGAGSYGSATPSFAFLSPSENYQTGLFAPDTPLRLDEIGRVYGKVGENYPAPGLETKAVPFQVQPRAGDCDSSLPQTAHSGGMTVALGDGSVRTVGRGVSQWTFWAACTPAGGEVLGNDW